jgi:pimeloyl-ACP methyl ester carboxylesterase
VRDTARRYGAELLEFPGLGHDLMLDSGGDEVADAMLGWLDARAPSV